MRRVPVLLVTAGLVITALSGCSSSAQADCDIPSGAASNLVSASGKFGGQLKVSFPTPLTTKKAEQSFLKQGKGALLTGGQVIQVSSAIFDGKSGIPQKGAPPFVVVPKETSGPAGLGDAFRCAKVGSRLAVVLPPVVDPNTPDPNAPKKAPPPPIVAVFDIESALPAKANGTPQPGQSGFPTVVLAPNGQPGIKVPGIPAPNKVKIATLKKGHGTAVKKGDQVIVNYTGVLWKDNTVFGSSWNDGSPVAVFAGKRGAQQGPLVPGAADALAGVTIGSQIIVIVPPKEGYGKQGSGAVPADATLAYVIDVLGTIK